MNWGPYSSEAEATRRSWSLVRSVVPGWSEAAQQVALAIGYAESRFGVTPDWQLSDGTPSWNWGAMVATKSMIESGSFLAHADHDKDGNPTTYRFAAYPSAREGFARWARNFPADAVSAAQRGDARAVSAAMYRARWFTGTKGSDSDRIDAYAKVIYGAAKHTSEKVGTILQVRLGSSSASPRRTGMASALFLGGVVAAATAVLISRR